MKVRFSCRAHIPQKATIGSVCYDLFAAKPTDLEPNSTRSVETNIGFSFSKNRLLKYFRDQACLYILFTSEEE